MSKNLRWVALALLTFAVMAPAAWAQEEEAAAAEPEKNWTLGFTADYSSIYLFRGVDLLDDEPVLWGSAKVTFGGLAIYTYAFAADIPGSEEDYREADFGLDYTFSLGDKVALTLGALTYQYSSDVEETIGFLDTNEVYAIIAFDVPLAPIISYYHDIDVIDGGYASIGISHSFPAGSKVAFVLSGALGFDFHYNNKEKSNGALNDFLIGLNVPIQITDMISVHAQVQRSVALDSLDGRAEDDPALAGLFEDETVFTFGGALSF